MESLDSSEDYVRALSRLVVNAVRLQSADEDCIIQRRSEYERSVLDITSFPVEDQRQFMPDIMECNSMYVYSLLKFGT
jgi:hypothetical protein